jgi:hypothetical protein
MRLASEIVSLSLLIALAACNTSQTGANERIAFTPQNCGQPAEGCDLADSMGVYGKISMTIDGLNGQPTAGLDLASRDPARLTVEPTADIGGQPAWELTAHAAGVVQVAAVDAGGTEIDFVEVPIQEVLALTMQPYTSNIVGPSDETGYDEAFTVNADEPVAWNVRPLIAGDVTTMGRFMFETVTITGEPDVTDFELGTSDRPNGYLYVDLPAGDYPVEFQLSDDPDAIFVSAIIHSL